MHALRTDSRPAARPLTAKDVSIRESADHSTPSRSVPPEIGTARGGRGRALALVGGNYGGARGGGGGGAPREAGRGARAGGGAAALCPPLHEDMNGVGVILAA